MFKTPILLIVFNRIETTRQVFARIKQVQPARLFIAADGPRMDKSGEAEKCEEVRKWIVSQVDWDCELMTLFQTENIGCGRGPVIAMNWFFENVEQGIILEDDCLPSLSFFPFCEELLEKYKEDKKIHSISGTNLISDYNFLENSYFFSYQSSTWGWATWKRSWIKYDYYITDWGSQEVIKNFKAFFRNEVERDVYVHALEKAFNKEIISWWDYQFIFSRIIQSSYGIIPKKNLISNIGFGKDATHTMDTNSELFNINSYELDFPLVHPELPLVNYQYDHDYSSKFFPLFISKNNHKKFRHYNLYQNLFKKLKNKLFKNLK